MERVFNAEMLILARESRGLTQTELADRLGVSQGEVSKLENRLRVPDPEQVSRYAAALGYKEEFFYIGESIRGTGTGCTYHRKRQSAQVGLLRRLLAIVNVRRIQIGRLLRATEIQAQNKFARLDLEASDRTPELTARMMRAYFQLPPGPVQSMTRVIEDAGGIVVLMDFKTTKVDAISQLAPGSPPLFFVNMNTPTDRLRWTLAHELGHVVMHQLPTEAMEKEADRYAAEFLMPAKEIKSHLYDLTLPKLASLKPFWKVSMVSLLRRAGELDTISTRRKEYLWTHMGKKGYRSVEPGPPLPREQPTLLNELVSVHREQLGYSMRDLSDALYTEDETETRNILQQQQQDSPGLRLVR